MPNNNFNERIRELREKKGLSQEELANLSGLSLRTIQRIEKGETNPLGDTKRKIVKILDFLPDLDFNDEGNIVEKIDFLQNMVVKYEYPFMLFVLSLLLILCLGFYGGIIIFGLIIGLFSLVLLVMSTNYHLKNKGFKKGCKYLITTLSLALIYLYLMGSIVPVRHVSISSVNGVTTKIEKNYITGKSDTTITVQKTNVNSLKPY